MRRKFDFATFVTVFFRDHLIRSFATVKLSRKYLNLQIHPPCNMVIGPWNMAVKTFHEEENGNLEVYTRKYHMDIIFLFNPWCKGKRSAHSGKSVTIRESNHASGVYKEHYAQYYVRKSSILLSGTGIWKN